jgi:hypothetical protein
MSHEGQNHKIKTGNKSIENVAKFKYSGMTEQIKIKFTEKLRAD